MTKRTQGINDGAGALVLASEEALVENEKLGLKPLARVVGYEAVGCKPTLMGIGPVGAIRILLENAGLTLDKIDLFEVNEVQYCTSRYCTVRVVNSRVEQQSAQFISGQCSALYCTCTCTLLVPSYVPVYSHITC